MAPQVPYMVDRDKLLLRARYAYEVGRWKMAVRVLVIVIPVAALSGTLSQRPLACLGLALLLGVSLTVLRWRNRRGLRIANVGLAAGLLPLSAGLLAPQLGSASFPALLICTGSGLLAGAWAGASLIG